ncbi:YbaB/EbfC family nucleoid-associated protein [Micromonospora sp. WMMD1102]|uniref:YbaB/EbfC family nucleoid-associated protein n=1 Tax=Micromonospora sp. WMMD1102 TaxID=3016105 RepID=UPI00241535BC|nr:YbaB/EbfC family nucleoid-associated protein [Micromonospora sp. WMMD1102]MDG4789088.1 YbaB/EbfC family nucleoid-associated protein [Micromonospora sp. WMMD1102]
MVHSFEATRARILEAGEAVSRIQVTRQSDDRSIEVTVGHDREVVDLQIADSALRRSDGRAIADTVLSLIAQAQAEFSRTAQEDYQRITGLHLDPSALDGPAVLGRLSRELFGG